MRSKACATVLCLSLFFVLAFGDSGEDVQAVVSSRQGKGTWLSGPTVATTFLLSLGKPGI